MQLRHEAIRNIDQSDNKGNAEAPHIQRKYCITV